MSKTHFDVDLEAELEGVEDSDEDMDKVPSYINFCCCITTIYQYLSCQLIYISV